MRSVSAMIVVGSMSLLTNSDLLANSIYYFPGTGHYYQLTSSATDWQSAENEAIALGGHLVAISSLDEQQFINETFLVGDNEKKAFWIGLSDAASEGIWQWTSGDLYEFSNWYDYPPETEPNNGGPCGGFCPENYVAINWHYAFYGYGPDYLWANFPGEAAKGTWNDTPINGTPVPFPYYGIMEFSNSPVVPLPAGIWLFGSALAVLAWIRRRGELIPLPRV